MKRENGYLKLLMILTLTITFGFLSNHSVINAESIETELERVEEGEPVPPGGDETTPTELEEMPQEETEQEQLLGDLNEDGELSIADLALISLSLGKDQLIDEDWAIHEHADVNQDNKVDIEDLIHVANIILTRSN